MPSIIAIDFDLTLSPFSFPKEIDLNAIADKTKIGEEIKRQIANTYDVDSYDKVQEYMTNYVNPFLQTEFGNTKITILTVNRAKNVLNILEHFGININMGFKVVSVTDLGTTKVDWVLDQLTSEYNNIVFLDDSPSEQKAMQAAIDCNTTKSGRDSTFLKGHVISIPRPPRKGPFKEYGMFGERGWLDSVTMVTRGMYQKFDSKVTFWQVFLRGLWSDGIQNVIQLNKERASEASKAQQKDNIVPTFKTFKLNC